MKKVLYLMLILSAVTFGEGNFEASEEILETQFETEHSTISDGETQIKDIEYDLIISENKGLLNLEVESMFSNSNWSKFDKQEFSKMMVKLVNDIRTEVENPDLSVTVFLKYDKPVGDEELLFNKTY